MAGPIKITLLTHGKEFGKRSNTGQVVAQVLGAQVERIRWERMHPPLQLVEEIAAGGVALVYPGSQQEQSGELTDIRQFIVIDGTWLTARRIYQRSPYLHHLRRVSLHPQAPSRYNLRKNQKAEGLCTAECVVELLRGVGSSDQAEQLLRAFLAYQKPEKRAATDEPVAPPPAFAEEVAPAPQGAAAPERASCASAASPWSDSGPSTDPTT